MNDSEGSNQGKNWITENLLLLWETIGKIETKFRILMTKCSLKTCIVLSSFDKEGSL